VKKGDAMSMLQEFKEFAMKGNVMDLAVGVIIGGAFGKIVDSVVADLIMPFMAWIMGGKLDFSGMFLVLGTVPEGTATTLDALKKAQVPGLRLRQLPDHPGQLHHPRLHHLHHDQADEPPEAAAPEPPAPAGGRATAEDVLLLREIRDSLKK
jgi:large conductance mechanosensitive channel